MPTHALKTLFRTTRPPFLVLTPASVFLGLATALASGARVSAIDILLVLLGALCAHISVNTFNEYFDFRSGLDARTQKTPFSGGSGALPDNPAAAAAVLTLATISLLITILIGLVFWARIGHGILPLGMLGVLIVVCYTPWMNRKPLLCLMAPGLGFGPLMVLGTYLVTTGEYSARAAFVSMVPFFLVNNLLLLNQFPDIEADASVGRRHFPIVFGVEKSARIFRSFAFAPAILIAVGVMFGDLPTLALFALIPLALSVTVMQGIGRYVAEANQTIGGNDSAALVQAMGTNVIVTLLTPTVLGLCLLFG